MAASHRIVSRPLVLAIAVLLLPAAVLAATGAPDGGVPTPDATPSTSHGAPTRAEIERIVERAQEQAREAVERAEAYARRLQGEHEMLAQGNRDLLAAELDYELELPNLAFIGSEFGSAREIVKNAPYTADAVTESIQVLQDGNRIVKRGTTKLARDTYGRTRQEKEGPHGAAIYIFDPIDNRNYVLNPQKRVATRIPRVPAPPVPPLPAMPPMPPQAPGSWLTPPTPMPPTSDASPAQAPAVGDGADRVIVRRTEGPSRGDDVRVEVIRIGEPGRAQGTSMPPIAMPLLPAGKGERKSLGTRDFDGVKADGTQTTQTIAAGEIGNEKPIVIVSERWFSPELQLVVFARTRDPRAGETTYRLANLKRGEPPAELFRVPSDYRARESRG